MRDLTAFSIILILLLIIFDFLYLAYIVLFALVLTYLYNDIIKLIKRHWKAFFIAYNTKQKYCMLFLVFLGHFKAFSLFLVYLYYSILIYLNIAYYIN